MSAHGLSLDVNLAFYQHDHLELWQEAVEGERPWPRTLSKRDAAAWVRAVRRFGLEARLPDIAREVGPALEGAPHSALCALLAPSPPSKRTLPSFHGPA